MESAKPTVLIAGAGVSGLGLALFLSKSGKYNIQVFERAAEITPAIGGHYGLNGALDCPDRAGFHHLWAPLCHELETLQVRYPHAHTKCRVDISFRRMLMGTEFDNKFGTFMRSEFQAALANALPEGVVQYGKKIVRVRELEESVQVEFADGSRAIGDLLFGADGIRSVVRREVFGHVPLIYSGIKVWWFVSGDSAPEHLHRTFVELQTRDAMVLCITAGAQKKQVILIAQHSPEPSQDDLKEQGSIERFHELCANHGVYSEGLLTEDRARMGRVMHFPLNHMPAGRSRERWFRGRVCLLGDAIHATTPFLAQGANQAMQSAFCLARLLEERHVDEYASIFEEYHAIREPPTTSIIEKSGAMGRLRVPRESEGCLVGLRRWILYQLPRFMPSALGKLAVSQFTVKV
eukprot:TRINITY_DN32548_c0_g1_i1.p1 TRINITY_DN32548_c0_g1~~TRINITY_DN32548_c0_g1_i1.p1  ORF type:complete len:406 (-),score=39.23 TRINITY_DN32548_c0_g1_i1:242-1459(-)